MNSVCLYGVLSILESFFPLYFLYSKHHNQLPKNVDPNTVSSNWETLVANDKFIETKVAAMNCGVLTFN